VDNPLVQPDPGLYIWTILTFLVLLGVLAKFAWTPLLRALEARRQGIADALQGADRAREEFERLRREAAELTNQARVEASAIIAASRSDSERLRVELKADARKEAAAVIAAAERQIQLESARAREQLRGEVVELSVQIASKLVRRHLTRADNEALIEEVLKQVEARPQ
jgi:F-type H+-transporting ATPase subunit b